MKVLQINTTCGAGGAARISDSIRRGLDERGIENWLAVKEASPAPDGRTIILPRSVGAPALNKLSGTDAAFFRTYGSLRSLPFWDEIDIVHLHNLHGGYFNVLDIPRIAREKPTLWTLHDPWILADRSSIPEYRTVFVRRNPVFQSLYRFAIRASDVRLISPSRWLAEKARSEYPDLRIEVIPNGVDISVFQPADRIAARTALGLPLDQPIALSVAHGGASNRNKGADYVRGIERRIGDKWRIVTLGGKGRYINDPRVLASYYAAADALLYPSLADNSPLAIMEAMAAGTPAVAFATGGIAELIEHRADGYVAAYKDESDLVRGLEFVLENRDRLSAAARAKAARAFDARVMTDAYLDRYRALAGGRAHPRA
jgi:glycosyltransferase involved in cell wall biosynthesis